MSVGALWCVRRVRKKEVRRSIGDGGAARSSCGVLSVESVGNGIGDEADAVGQGVREGEDGVDRKWRVGRGGEERRETIRPLVSSFNLAPPPLPPFPHLPQPDPVPRPLELRYGNPCHRRRMRS